MAKLSWLFKLLPFLRLFTKKVEDGTIGAGSKTAEVGKVAGEILNATEEAIGGSDKDS